MIRPVALAALTAVAGLAVVPAQAQETTPEPEVIVVQTPENEARKRFNEGNDLLRQEDYGGALAKFEEGLAEDPTSNKNAYGRALALVQLDREDDAIEAFEQAIALSDTASDTETATAARRAVGTMAFNDGMSLMAANPLPRATAEQALPMLTRADEYGVESNQLAYQLARAQNALGNHDEAARYAERAIEDNADVDDKSAYYIELGLAHMNGGNADDARAAFEMAREGSWSGWADHYLRELDGGEAAGG